MKKILVTGEKGNLSTAIADWLRMRGCEVDNVGLRDSSWKEKNFSSYDSVVHVAGLVPKSDVKAEDFYRINTRLTKAFAEKVKADGVKHFCYISTMAVYGKEGSICQRKGRIDKQTPPAPISDYGKSKLQAEHALRELEDDEFQVAIVRVPSVYGKGKREYFEQYAYLSDKFPKIPKAFSKNYKSVICIDNLSELLYLIVDHASVGVFCPDDGKYSATEFCALVRPEKKTSRLLGIMIQTMLRFSDRIRDYYGAIYYAEELANCFNGAYRVLTIEEAVRKTYEQ